MDQLLVGRRTVLSLTLESAFISCQDVQSHNRSCLLCILGIIKPKNQPGRVGMLEISFAAAAVAKLLSHQRLLFRLLEDIFALKIQQGYLPLWLSFFSRLLLLIQHPFRVNSRWKVLPRCPRLAPAFRIGLLCFSPKNMYIYI